MIDLPEELKRQHLREQLGQQGTVFRFRCEDLDDPNREYRHKFAAVVSLQLDQDELLYSLTTSKVEVYATGRWSLEVLRLSPSTYNFLTKDTVLVLRDIKALRVEDVLRLPTPADMSVVGALTAADLKTAVEIIRRSPTIERRLKKRCCPSSGSA
jgi:hypothetical protein